MFLLHVYTGKSYGIRNGIWLQKYLLQLQMWILHINAPSPYHFKSREQQAEGWEEIHSASHISLCIPRHSPQSIIRGVRLVCVWSGMIVFLIDSTWIKLPLSTAGMVCIYSIFIFQYSLSAKLPQYDTEIQNILYKLNNISLTLPSSTYGVQCYRGVTCLK